MHGTIDLAGESHQQAARERARSIPLGNFDVSNPELFTTDSFWPYSDRLRKEAPVHYCKDSMFGPYWSVTKYNDIMEIETNHAVFSSASSLGGITIRDVAYGDAAERGRRREHRVIGFDFHDVVVFGDRPVRPEHAVLAIMHRRFLA